VNLMFSTPARPSSGSSTAGKRSRSAPRGA